MPGEGLEPPQLAELAELHEAQGLKEILAEGVTALVADVQQQATAGPITPEKIQRLKPSPAVIEKMRRKVAAELNRAYTESKRLAVDELAQARERPIPRTTTEPEKK